MPKKMSVEISDDTHKQLSNLASHYDLDIKQVINSILIATGRNEGRITQLSEISGPNKSLDSTLNATLDNYLVIAHLFNDVLSKVKAEGKFEVDIANVEINWEDGYFRFRFDASTDGYNVSSIEVMKEDGRYNFSTYTGIQLEEAKNNSFDDLKEIAESMENPFDVDECRIHVDDIDEDFCELIIDCWDESIEYLPSVNQADKVIKKILRAAKVKLEK
jgi:hypothetical protein